MRQPDACGTKSTPIEVPAVAVAREVTIRDEPGTDSSFIMGLVVDDPRRQARPERRLMTKRLLALGCAVTVPFVFSALEQTAGPGSALMARTAGPSLAAQPPASPAPSSSQRALLDRYCVGCHSQRAKAAGQDSARKLTLDDLDPARVSEHPDKWELVVRKLRAGMMPPANSRRPDKATYDGFITWLEDELDRTAVVYTPPPGLHRLNRTEYANAIRDVLDLAIDPGAYLPSDDSTHGFDNIAGALGISSTLIEAYVNAAGKISRLAIGEPTTPGLVVYRTPEDTSQDYHIEGLPFGTRGGILQKHVFPSDGEYTITVTPIFGDNMSPTGFGSVPCEKLEILLDGERLALVDWQGSRRLGAPQANCGGQRASAPQRGARPQDHDAPRDSRVPASRVRRRRPGVDGVLSDGPQGRRFRARRRDGAHADPGRSALHLSHRNRAVDCENEPALSHH